MITLASLMGPLTGWGVRLPPSKGVSNTPLGNPGSAPGRRGGRLKFAVHAAEFCLSLSRLPFILQIDFAFKVTGAGIGPVHGVIKL